MRDELKYPRAFALMPVPIEMAYNKQVKRKIKTPLK